MRVDAVELFVVRMPLVAAFRSATATESVREVVVLCAETSAGEGWGECAAQETPHYSPEFVDGALRVLRRFLLPPLLAAADVGAADVAQLLAGVRGHRMAKAAVETAVLDAELRAAGVSLASHLGGVRQRVTAGVAVGIEESTAALLEVVGRYVEAGYERVKLKIEPGWDLEPVRAVRERHGELLLQVDGNGAYTRDDIDHLVRLDEFEILMLEQPFEEDDLLAHAELERRSRTPVCLDESVVSARGAEAAIELGACSVVNVKAGRVGGYLEARRVHDVCLAGGVPVLCGGMLETGIGRAANLALASLPGFRFPGDLSASARYFAHDLTAPHVLEDGEIAVPSGPGLGVEVDRDALDAVTVARERFTRDP